MVKCRAIRDGLVGTSYVHAGEDFAAESCPAWAEVIEKKASSKAGPKAKAKAEIEAGVEEKVGE